MLSPCNHYTYIVCNSQIIDSPSTILLLKCWQGPLDEYSTFYVAACAVLALEHLHYLDIIYRGLNAATMMVSEGGLMQLVDFRFAKKNEVGV